VGRCLMKNISVFIAGAVVLALSLRKRNKNRKSSEKMTVEPAVEPAVGAAPGSWKEFQQKMKEAEMSAAAIKAFEENYKALVSGQKTTMPESEISPVESLDRLDDVKEPGDVSELLRQTAVLKLNGGLGTSMGLEKAKSLLVVKDDKTFLDLIAQQVKYMRKEYKSETQFILMNSFSTSDDTRSFLKRKHSDLLEEKNIELVQNKSPKVDAETLKPASFPENPDLEWCPPGHGDIYASLIGSGMLDRLIADGIKYLFVSNSDNLGATLDLKLLNYFAESKLGFLMEVADRTEADKKGGHLCYNANKRLCLRESAQCEPEDEVRFQNVQKHKYFNTNNLWIELSQLKQATKGGSMPLPLIKNSKTVDPRDKKSAKVFQLETAMGAAIESFEKAGAIAVPRTRFAPVKTCNDLVCLRSDAYKVTDDFRMQAAVAHPPLIKLDDSHYKLVDQLEELMPTIPSLKYCESLNVQGKVKFDPFVIIKGKQVIKNAGSETKTLSSGTYSDSTKVL